jgi:hypothetical protein
VGNSGRYRRFALDLAKVRKGRNDRFIAASRVMIERISFEVQDILAGDNRAVILGSLEPKIK